MVDLIINELHTCFGVKSNTVRIIFISKQFTDQLLFYLNKCYFLLYNMFNTAGSINLPTYITSSTMVAAQWDGFTSEEDMMIYYVALSDHDGAKVVDCKQMVINFLSYHTFLNVEYCR